MLSCLLLRNINFKGTFIFKGLSKFSSTCDHKMSDIVERLAKEQAIHFEHDSSPTGRSLRLGFLNLAHHCSTVTPLLNKLREEASKYDFDPKVPGNGYRSFIHVFDSCFKCCATTCEEVDRDRNRWIFFLRKGYYANQLSSWNSVLISLETCLDHLHTLMKWNDNHEVYSLFPVEHHSARELLERAKSTDQYCFYGRHLGFQFCKSMEYTLKVLLVAMAGYSDYYFSTSQPIWGFAKSLFMGLTYALDPEHKARRVVNVSQFSTVDFCKAFWFLAEMDIVNKIQNRLCPSLAVNRVLEIAVEPLKLGVEDGRVVNIPIPSSHGPPRPIAARLLSAKERQGMVGNTASQITNSPSDSIMIHCHGGGFVAQSSKSHEVYLRQWAVDLDIPILSIDYSLSPEYPFPRPLQEVLYVYAWVLRNAEVLGTTGKKIILAGDSAGANLVLTTTLWASELNIPLPTGLFLAYVPALVQFIPSPSRLLCLTDPLLPFGFMMRCLNAYAGHTMQDLNSENDSSDIHSQQSDKSKHSTIRDPEQLDQLEAHDPSEELDLFKVSNSPLLSPYLASDTAIKKLPPISLMTVLLDPCLDDSVELAKRIRQLGGEVTLDVLEGLPHGFLNFGLVSSEAREGSKRCVEIMKKLLEK